MKILVTGGSGFVGTETIKLLKKEGHEIFNYDLMENYDIRSSKQLEEVVAGFQPNRILHLAAIARFADADKDPKLAAETNILGTMNVAAIAQQYHVPVVYSSTGSCYMPIQQKDTMLTEDARVVGNSVYGCTKTIGEKYIKELNPYIILRYAHLFGSEKRMHGLIGGFLERINRGLAPQLYGGAQTNSFTYIKDVARANVLALTAPWDKWNNVYNIGNREELSAKEAGEIICDVFNYKGEIEVKEARTVDPDRFWFSCEKASTMLGFDALFSFRKGLIDMAKELDYNVINGKITEKSVSKGMAE